MEFGFIDDGSSTTTDTETYDTHAETVLSGGVFETWLENGCSLENGVFREFTPEASQMVNQQVIQVVPPIIRKYHKPPSRDRISVSSLNTVVYLEVEDDEDDESILMPFIGDNEFDGDFPEHIITVENEKMIAMSNPQTLSILPTVQEAPIEFVDTSSQIGGTDCSKCSTKSIQAMCVEPNHTPSHSRSPSSHQFPHDQIGDEILTDTEVLTDTEELISDQECSSISWTEEDDVDITEITETHQEDSVINSYLKDYLEEKDKREAETSSNLKRAPNRDLVPTPVHNNEMRVTSHRPQLSVVSESTSLNRRPQYVDFQPSLTPGNGSASFSRERAIEDLNPAPPQPHGEMTSFPQVVPHFDDTKQSLHPIDVYFEHYQQARTPSDRSPSLTPMDKLLESLPPLPSKKSSLDSFHAVPTMYSPHLYKPPPLTTPALPQANAYTSNNEAKCIPSPANSFPKNQFSPSSNILLCKVEPEKKSAFSMQFSASDVKKRHEEMKKKTHDRTISDLDFSDILSDDLLSDFEKGPSHEVRSGIPFLTMLVNEQQDIRIRVIE